MFTAQPRPGYAAGRSKTQCMPLSLLDARTTRVMLAERERAFLLGRRVARLASADAQGEPHVVPVCFALSESSVYITIDRKPKREGARALKRLRNIAENPAVALVADHYEEDWSRLAWVMLRGRAEILHEGREHDPGAGAAARTLPPSTGTWPWRRYRSSRSGSPAWRAGGTSRPPTRPGRGAGSERRPAHPCPAAGQGPREREAAALSSLLDAHERRGLFAAMLEGRARSPRRGGVGCRGFS